MNSKHTSEEKQNIITAYKAGKRVSLLVTETGIPRSTIYAWLTDERAENSEKGTSFTLREYRSLENKVNRLKGIIEILQKAPCTATAPLEDRLYALDDLHDQYSVHMLCDALCVPRGTFYNYLLRSKRGCAWYDKRREELRQKIQTVYDDGRQIYGAGKIAAILKEQGCRVSEQMVRELMQDMGLCSIRQGAKKQYDKETKWCKNYLNQQFTATRPNEIWVSDVTYFRYKEKALYICVIIDLYARMVVGFRIGLKNSTRLIKSTFKIAYEQRQPQLPLLFHTDRGSNYRSNAFCAYLQSLGVTQSFSRAHVPYDNSVMESFFASMKREELYRTKYRSEQELRAAIAEYIKFYNETRPHVKNGYKTPTKKEQEYYENSKQTEKK